MKLKVIYTIATGEIYGDGIDGISAEPPLAVTDAPVNWTEYPKYFWHWNGVDAIELKTGAELAAAEAQQKGEIAQVVIDKHAKADATAVRTVGAFEENGDIVNQMLLAVVEHLVNGVPIDKTLYEQYALYHSKMSTIWSTKLATISEADMDKIAARKKKARANAQDIVNDPDWPYTP